jgi:hypothetical protein
MLLKMIPTGLGMSTRTTFGDDQTETTHWLSFTLQVAGHDSLKLETGEVLENPAYASIRGNKPNEISANLTVHPASDKRGPSLNAMTYFEAMEGDDYSFPSDRRIAILHATEPWNSIKSATNRSCSRSGKFRR